MRRAAAWLLAALAAFAAHAQPSLELPLACTPGEDCWIANHVDLDPGPAVRDYTCGTFSYEGHSGTDFAVRDLAAMREGVAVLAAAAGTVAATRDGVADQSVRERGEKSVEGRGCGNAVRIDHGGGWQTLYCHLRRGSVAVRKGERVSAGQRVGLVGLSGLTEYPHLHFGVLQERRMVDPFRGVEPAQSCGAGERPLWNPATLTRLPYATGVVYNFGVAAELPRAEDARAGKHRERSIARDAPGIVVWADVFATRAGEALQLRVEAPDGRVLLERRLAFEKSQARAFRAFGRKRGAAPWQPGTYRVTITPEKPGERGREPAAARFSFEVP